MNGAKSSSTFQLAHMTDPESIREQVGNDPLRRMRAYQLAETLLSLAWDDCEQLLSNGTTRRIAEQLYCAVGSIKANLAEGYSRSSGRDRARIFEYALGSARESIEWYIAGEPVLGRGTVLERHRVLVEIRRLLIATIPRERNRTIRPGSATSN